MGSLFFAGPMQASTLKKDILKETLFSAKDTYDTTKTDEAPLVKAVQNGINVVLGILGVVAVIMILYSGFLWLTAGGSEENVTKAKKIIKQAAIGIIIISLAYGIVGFVFRAVPTAPEAPKASDAAVTERVGQTSPDPSAE